MLSFGGKSHWITALDRQPTQITVHISSFTFDWFIVLRCNSIIRLISAGSLEITDTFNKWCNQKWIQYELSIYKKCMIISQGSIFVLFWFDFLTELTESMKMIFISLLAKSWRSWCNNIFFISSPVRRLFNLIQFF